MSTLGTLAIKMLSLSLLLGLLVYGANAAHTPSPLQLGDITVLAQNNLRSKLSHMPYCSVSEPSNGIDGAEPG